MRIQSNVTLLCILALTVPSIADTFVMKDGSTFEGTILRKEADSYVVEVQVTKSIKDERVIAKADVASITAVKPDLVAFEEIAALIPVPDALSQDEYAQRIRKADGFITEHRGSSKTTKAREILATLKAEANEILAGAIKLGGKIIPPSEYRSNAYDIDARIAAAGINKLINEARYLEALRAFADFDRDFANTTAYKELTPLVKRVITTYLAGITQSLNTHDARAKDRMAGLEQMTAGDRRTSEGAIAEQTAAFEKRLKAEKDANIGWVTTHPFFKPSLEQTLTYGKQELARLAAAESAPGVDAGKLYRDALALIHGGGTQLEVTAAMTAVKSAAVAPRYIENLEAAATSAGFKP